ncbi:MAG: hypothetical protein J1G06_01330 [Oscillospiraceae bacterium]|nr:hypothetical protein [Oscillospiraceae bacterium]
MDYEEARRYIQGLTPRGIKPGLTNITRLCSALRNPERGQNFIHIAGTNGKGSVGAFLGSIMNVTGMSVGRFVSPAVGDYLESFTINGSPIQATLYAKCAEKVKHAADILEADGIFPTSFEAETAIAFLAFKELLPDYVLLECGMGGRLDSTNIIESPYSSIITSISLDHKKFLGNTLAKIAAEKCGIIKDNCPIITCKQPDEIMEVIARNAIEHDSPLYIADDIENICAYPDKTIFTFEGREYEINLLGTYQPQNAALAIKAAQVIGISYGSIFDGLKKAKWEYRFERLGKYILDGAHNKGAAIALAGSMSEYLSGKTAFICGCFKDKDYKRIVEITAPYADTVYCIKPPGERGLNSETLCEEYRAAGVVNTVNSETMSEAVKAVSEAKYDNVVIFGSLSILAEAKRIIKRLEN